MSGKNRRAARGIVAVGIVAVATSMLAACSTNTSGNSGGDTTSGTTSSVTSAAGSASATGGSASATGGGSATASGSATGSASATGSPSGTASGTGIAPGTTGIDQTAGTVTIASNTSDPEKALIALFEKQYPNIKVTQANIPSANYTQVVSTQLAGGTAADLIRSWPGNGSNLSVVQATKKGFFADLSDMAFVAKVPDAVKPVLESEDGKLSAVPMTTSAIGGVYNKTLMDKNGMTIPTTWSGVLSFCAKAKAAGLVAYGLGLKDSWTGQFIPYALTATLVSPEEAKAIASGKEKFADSKWRAAYTMYEQMGKAGCFTKDPNGTSYSNVEDQMAKGTTLGWVTLSLSTGEVAKAAPAGTDMVFTAFPATDDASQTMLSNGTGAVFSLNTKSKNADATKKLIDFMATPEAQAVYAKAANSSPALDTNGAFKDDPVSTLISDYTTKGKVSSWPDQSWPNPAVQQAMFDGVQGLFAGTENVDDVLAGMDKAMQG